MKTKKVRELKTKTVREKMLGQDVDACPPPEVERSAAAQPDAITQMDLFAAAALAGITAMSPANIGRCDMRLAWLVAGWMMEERRRRLVLEREEALRKRQEVRK